MYQIYQVVVVAEDGEYILSEWQTEQRAIDEINREASNYGQGQRLELRKASRGF
jgi:hypothetical protein